MHELPQLCGDIEDGSTKHAAVLHPWSQVSGTGETQIIIAETLASYSKVFKMQGYRNLLAQLIQVPVKVGGAKQLWSLFQSLLIIWFLTY